MSVPKVDEERIKAVVLNKLRRDGRLSTRGVISSEFRVGWEGVRADLVVLDDLLIGVEIKSDLDSLRRLAGQVNIYERFFDLTIVVLASRHFKSSTWAMVGAAEVWELTKRGTLKQRRAAKVSSQCASPQLRLLLTKAEAQRVKIRELLNQSDLTFSPEERHSLIKKAFQVAFCSRFGETSRTFWRSVEGREIEESDLRILSRFASLRITQDQARARRNSVFDHWIELAEAHESAALAA